MNPLGAKTAPPGPPLVSRDLADAEPLLVERFLELREEYERRFSPKLLLVTCTHRSPASQWGLFQQGRTKPGQIVTWKDGVTRKSLHNFKPSRALDVAVQWDEDPRPDIVKMHVDFEDLGGYRPLVPLARLHRLFSGGEWRAADWPHLELLKEDIACL